MKVEFYFFTGGQLPMSEAQREACLELARKRGWKGEDLPSHDLDTRFEGEPVRVWFEA